MNHQQRALPHDLLASAVPSRLDRPEMVGRGGWGSRKSEEPGEHGPCWPRSVRRRAAPHQLFRGEVAKGNPVLRFEHPDMTVYSQDGVPQDVAGVVMALTAVIRAVRWIAQQGGAITFPRS